MVGRIEDASRSRGGLTPRGACRKTFARTHRPLTTQITRPLRRIKSAARNDSRGFGVLIGPRLPAVDAGGLTATAAQERKSPRTLRSTGFAQVRRPGSEELVPDANQVGTTTRIREPRIVATLERRHLNGPRWVFVEQIEDAASDRQVPDACPRDRRVEH